MKFYFCEKCGARLTEEAIRAGAARDKKLHGVYCQACAEGVLTLETLPLTQQGAEELLRRQAPSVPAAQLPISEAPQDLRRRSRSSGIRTLPPRAPGATGAPAKPAAVARERKPLTVGPSRNLMALGGGAALVVVAVALWLVLSRISRGPQGPTTLVRDNAPLVQLPRTNPPAEFEAAKTSPHEGPASSVAPVPLPPDGDPLQELFDRLMQLPSATPGERAARVDAAEAFIREHHESLLAARLGVTLEAWKNESVADAPRPADPPPQPGRPSDPPTASSSEPLPEEPSETSSSGPEKLQELPLVALSHSESPADGISIKEGAHGNYVTFVPLGGFAFHLVVYTASKAHLIPLAARKFVFAESPKPHPQWPMAENPPIWWDFNADGKTDAWSDKLYVGDGAGGFVKSELAAQGNWIDLDGDGAPEELFRAGGFGDPGSTFLVEPKLRLWFAQQSAKLKLTPSWKAKDLLGWPIKWQDRGNAYSRAFSADLDGDHRGELLVYFLGGKWRSSDGLRTSVLALKNPAGGPLGWADTTRDRGLDAVASQYLVPEDFDADGDLDLINAIHGELWANDGRGRFEKLAGRLFPPKRPGRKSNDPPSVGMTVPRFVDLDNNGFRDLVLGDSNYGYYYGTFLNLGDGRFVEAASLSTLHDQVAFADLDADGDLDAATIRGGKCVLYRNDTTGKGLQFRVQPRFASLAFLGSKLWVYDPARKDEHGQSLLIHYRQGIYAYDLAPVQHLGLGEAAVVDLKVRFVTGAERWVRGAKAGTEVILRE